MSTFYQKDYLSVDVLTKEDVMYLFDKAITMKNLVKEKGGSESLKGKILAPLFFEPSSRTMGSFSAAMLRLGGGVIPLASMANASTAKGESLSDTAHVFSATADVIVMRHPEVGSAKACADAAYVPVINAGDGIGEHPTQALLDALTIYDECGTLDNVNVAFIGELKHYRAVNSLARLLSLFEGCKMSFISAPEFSLNADTRKLLEERNIEYREYTEPDEVINEVDVLYVTRPKKELIPADEYERAVGKYIVTLDMVNRMKQKSIVMHALPRLDEIAVEVDSDPRAVYLTRQMQNGLYMRMALLEAILLDKE